MKIPKISKKAAVVSGVVVLGLVGGVSAEVTNKHDQHSVKNETTSSQPATQADTTPVAVTPEPTAPAAMQTAPSSSTSSNQTPQSAPAPVVVTTYREVVIDPYTSDCEYTYSDGTTYTFHWKTPTQVTVNGQTLTATRTNGTCDSSIIGVDKATSQKGNS